jgi:hypothetical protein
MWQTLICGLAAGVIPKRKKQSICRNPGNERRCKNKNGLQMIEGEVVSSSQRLEENEILVVSVLVCKLGKVISWWHSLWCGAVFCDVEV